MEVFWFFVKLIALMALQAWLTPRRDSPTAEDVSLPTVSQSRKIPLCFGRQKISGPNVMESTPAYTQPIKVRTSLFGGKETIGYRYYMDIEFGIAYGPGELYKIYYGDYLILDTAITTDSTTAINQSEIFGAGDAPGGGGFRGTVRFIPGSAVGVINSTLQTKVGRNQPGNPYLARAYMYEGTAVNQGAYWGNAATFRPMAFDYGYYPNPFSASPIPKIGSDANPAYALYTLNHDAVYGLNIRGQVNISDITSMAATLASEGIGISRVFYEGDGQAMEREILDLIEGVRYRDATTGQVRYRLIREGGDVSPLPTLDETHILEINLEGNTVSATGTEVKITYVDRDAGYKPITLTESNAAAFQLLGRTVTVTREFPGCSNAALARKLAQREALKLTKPLRRGRLVCDRIAWDWAIGDAFSLSFSPMNFSNMVVRITEIDNGGLTDGRVTIDFIEDVFSYGSAVFDAPSLSTPTPLGSAPSDVTTEQAIELPVYLIGDLDDNAVILFAEDPGSAIDYELQLDTDTGGATWTLMGSGEFAPGFSVDATISASATSLVVVGEIWDVSPASESDILSNRRNILIAITDTGHELIGFESASYDSGTGKTTLSGLHRGLIDTFPRPIASADKCYLISDAQLIDYQFSDSQAFDYRYLPRTVQGQLAEGSATTQSYTIQNRYDAPLLPANVKINGSAFPASRTGGLTITWNHRDRTAQTTSTLDWDDATDQGPEAGVTYTVTLWDTSTSPWTQLDQQTGISVGTYSFAPSPNPTTSVRAEIKSVRSGTDSFMTFYHDFNWSP